MKLPTPNLWDSVGTTVPITRKGYFQQFFCKHERLTSFSHIDYRDGPGSFATTYVGTVCVACGKVLKRRLARADDYGNYPIARGELS